MPKFNGRKIVRGILFAIGAGISLANTLEATNDLRQLMYGQDELVTHVHLTNDAINDLGLKNKEETDESDTGTENDS